MANKKFKIGLTLKLKRGLTRQMKYEYLSYLSKVQNWLVTKYKSRFKK